MDIPSTGAIFTLGKSHLAENTQSYFYIKNDQIQRLVTGPAQSAVICDSGRVFVWGENQYGQLGIGDGLNQGATSSGDIITKPTCIKTLKHMGEKVGDIAFGTDWSVILTLNNKVFFAGRSIVPSSEGEGGTENHVRKPILLTEFNAILATLEEGEHFTNIEAGCEHFVLKTSNGRLFGWGSNQFNQLGIAAVDPSRPCQLFPNMRVEQYVCGPESTLILTESGNLYLTGKLKEFVFPQFTELQEIVSQGDHVIFMHISKVSEIFIITNSGLTYRSIESVRNKNLIFQRFFDYDSEEYGPIWKLLKGTSFYAILTKSHKFYTTFSESGHHLKTFREISKFKALRLLDIAIGDEHVLVHGLPRSPATAILPDFTENVQHMHLDLQHSQLQASAKESDEMSETHIGDQATPNVDDQNNVDTIDTIDNSSSDIIAEPTLVSPIIESSHQHLSSLIANRNESMSLPNTDNTPAPYDKRFYSPSTEPSAPIEEPLNAIPRTPNIQMKNSPRRNLSYEAAIGNVGQETTPENTTGGEDEPDNNDNRMLIANKAVTSPTADVSFSAEFNKDNITKCDDFIENEALVMNEIRFINNGVDVTANIKPDTFESEQFNETEHESSTHLPKQLDGISEDPITPTDYFKETDDSNEPLNGNESNHVTDTKSQHDQHVAAFDETIQSDLAAQLDATVEMISLKTPDDRYENIADDNSSERQFRVDDDEHTTASMKSNHTPDAIDFGKEHLVKSNTSLGSKHEIVAPIEDMKVNIDYSLHKGHDSELDEIKKSKIHNFFDHMREKAFFCNNEQSIIIDDGSVNNTREVTPPNKPGPIAKTTQQKDNQNYSSVCTIL